MIISLSSCLLIITVKSTLTLFFLIKHYITDLFSYRSKAYMCVDIIMAWYPIILVTLSIIQLAVYLVNGLDVMNFLDQYSVQMDPNNTPPVDPSAGGTPNSQPPQGGGPALVPVQDQHRDHDHNQARDTNEANPTADHGSAVINRHEARDMLDRMSKAPKGASFREAHFSVADMTKLRWMLEDEGFAEAKVFKKFSSASESTNLNTAISCKIVKDMLKAIASR